jgi:hypothetical protein
MRSTLRICRPLNNLGMFKCSHTIKITASGRGSYAATGAVSISASAFPMLDAARSLLKHGASPGDLLRGSFAEGNILPMSLASITKTRVHPRVDPRRSGSLNDAAMF